MKNLLASALALILMMTTCYQTDNERALNAILNAEELTIQLNSYGGLVGYHEQHFHLKKGEYETLLVIDEGTDYQTFTRIDDEEKALLKQFVAEAYKSNNPNKKMSNSCVTGIDSEYIIESGLARLRLVPNERYDSLFWMIVNDEG